MARQPASPFDFDMTRYLVDMKVPGVDVDTLVSAQKKNMEALTSANKAAFEGMQALMKRQAEIFRQSMEEASAMASALTASGSPQDKISKQAELARAAFEHALVNAKELSDIVARSNNDVAGLINERMTQAMDELKAALEQATTPPAKGK